MNKTRRSATPGLAGQKRIADGGKMLDWLRTIPGDACTAFSENQKGPPCGGPLVYISFVSTAALMPAYLLRISR